MLSVIYAVGITNKYFMLSVVMLNIIMLIVLVPFQHSLMFDSKAGAYQSG